MSLPDYRHREVGLICSRLSGSPVRGSDRGSAKDVEASGIDEERHSDVSAIASLIAPSKLPAIHACFPNRPLITS